MADYRHPIHLGRKGKWTFSLGDSRGVRIPIMSGIPHFRKVHLGFGSRPPPSPFPQTPILLHPPLIDGRTTCYWGKGNSNGNTQSQSLPHSHAIRSLFAKPSLWVRLPCEEEMCARLPSTIAHSPLGGIERVCEYALFPRPQTRVRSHPHPRPRGGVPFSEEESYLSFHSLPLPPRRGGLLALSYRSLP